MVVREGREEKVEYKIIALEYTRQVLRELVVTEKMLRRVETAVEDEIKEIFLYYLHLSLPFFIPVLFIFNIIFTYFYIYFIVHSNL